MSETPDIQALRKVAEDAIAEDERVSDGKASSVHIPAHYVLALLDERAALEQASFSLRERNEELSNAIATHRAYIHNARDRWPNAGDGDVQVTSGDISLWAETGIEEPTWTWKARFQDAEKALRNIAGERCESFMGPHQWECHYSDKTPDGNSLVTRWCDPCIAAAGLGFNPEPYASYDEELEATARADEIALNTPSAVTR